MENTQPKKTKKATNSTAKKTTKPKKTKVEQKAELNAKELKEKKEKEKEEILNKRIEEGERLLKEEQLAESKKMLETPAVQNKPVVETNNDLSLVKTLLYVVITLMVASLTLSIVSMKKIDTVANVVDKLSVISADGLGVSSNTNENVMSIRNVGEDYYNSKVVTPKTKTELLSLQNNRDYVVMFWQEGCGYCEQSMALIGDYYQNTGILGDRLDVYFVNLADIAVDQETGDYWFGDVMPEDLDDITDIEKIYIEATPTFVWVKTDGSFKIAIGSDNIDYVINEYNQ